MCRQRLITENGPWQPALFTKHHYFWAVAMSNHHAVLGLTTLVEGHLQLSIAIYGNFEILLESICCRNPPCRSTFPFCQWASGAAVVPRMEKRCRNCWNSSLLSSVPESTFISCGAPAQFSQFLWRQHGNEYRRLQTWYNWKLCPRLLVHTIPSMYILWLKPSSGFNLPGLWCLGAELAAHTGHLSSSAAFTMSGLCPVDCKARANLSLEGCPKFLWINSNWFCSHFGSAWK